MEKKVEIILSREEVDILIKGNYDKLMLKIEEGQLFVESQLNLYDIDMTTITLISEWIISCYEAIGGDYDEKICRTYKDLIDIEITIENNRGEICSINKICGSEIMRSLIKYAEI